MPSRLVVGLLLACAVIVPAFGGPGEPSIHRNGFAGRETFWRTGDANITWAEKAHRISDEFCKNPPTSEYIKAESNPPAGAMEAEFIHYFYPTPPALVTERLTAQVWVKSMRAGAQLKARVVFPKERDPKNPEAPLTVLLPGDSYRNVRHWQPLSLGLAADALRRQVQVLTAKLGRAIDPTDAFVDRLVINIYSGPGASEVWLDDLEIGPVTGEALPVPQSLQGSGGPTLPDRIAKAREVEFTQGQILIDGDPFFMLAVRHTDTPLKTLRDAQFNTVWFPGPVKPEQLEEAVRHGFWLVPTIPLPRDSWDGVAERTPAPDRQTLERDAAQVAGYLQRFLSGDAVLMWDLGLSRTAEDLPRVRQASEVIRAYDPRRPRAIDLWDGYFSFSSSVDCVGTHRWPLFTSLELPAYRDWLTQRRALTPRDKLPWTWVQTHLPDWMVELISGRTDVAGFDQPVGPHPEQIRLLTYMALASGCRGLGFWSDQFLSNTHHGRDRLLELALLNAEIEMLKPILLAAQGPAKWIPTSDPNVSAAVIQTKSELLLLPIWMGPGTQYCPPLGALAKLSIRVPLVPDGAIPWRVSAAGVQEIKGVQRVAGGVQIDLEEFDLTAPVVFTNDLKLDGKIVRWQDHTRYRMGELAARWAFAQANEQQFKTFRTHELIQQAGGPTIPEADEWASETQRHLNATREFLDNRQWDAAYREARRALRPLRSLMREHWRLATEKLDYPGASPYAVSYFTLPQHWWLAQEVARSRPVTSALPYGQFDLSRPAPPEGAAIASLPKWSVRKSVMGPVDVRAYIANSEGLEDPKKPRPPAKELRTGPGRVGYRPEPYELRRHPELGSHCLVLQAEAKTVLDAKGIPLPDPQALERMFLAVDTPPVDLSPGQLVRIRFWVKSPAPLHPSADGLVVYDSAGGEPMGVRLPATWSSWQQYHMYRRVPANGRIALTFALTGLGKVYIDDVCIEPMVEGLATPSDSNAVEPARR